MNLGIFLSPSLTRSYLIKLLNYGVFPLDFTFPQIWGSFDSWEVEQRGRTNHQNLVSIIRFRSKSFFLKTCTKAKPWGVEKCLRHLLCCSKIFLEGFFFLRTENIFWFFISREIIFGERDIAREEIWWPEVNLFAGNENMGFFLQSFKFLVDIALVIQWKCCFHVIFDVFFFCEKLIFPF